MHAGEPCGKRGIELLAYVTVTIMCLCCQLLIIAASRNHPLLNGVAGLVPCLLLSAFNSISTL